MAEHEQQKQPDVPEVHAVSKDGQVMVLESAAVTRLLGELRGELLWAGQPGYDSARRVWNSLIDRKPALIACCRGTADVIATVNFVRESGILMSIRSGGHDISGSAVCEGGLMLDLWRMKGIWVDPARRIVRVQPGVTVGELDHETQVFGLSVPSGIVSTTGIAGLTLNGGLGMLARSCGLSIDNLRSVDVVLADGRLVTASAERNADLFWGLRGGGGNFGVVTSLEFAAWEVGNVYAGMLLFHRELAECVLPVYRDIADNAPNELWLLGALLFMPDGTPVVGVMPCYRGPVESGEQLLKPLRECGAPLVDSMRVMTMQEAQDVLTEPGAWGCMNYWKGYMTEELTDDALKAIVSGAVKMESIQSAVLIDHNGGVIADVGETDTAFPHRHAKYTIIAHARWAADEPQDSEDHKRWARETIDRISGSTEKREYAGLFMQDKEAKVRSVFGINYDRLVQLKKKYDPENIFRSHVNIDPS